MFEMERAQLLFFSQDALPAKKILKHHTSKALRMFDDINVNNEICQSRQPAEARCKLLCPPDAGPFRLHCAPEL